MSIINEIQVPQNFYTMSKEGIIDFLDNREKIKVEHINYPSSEDGLKYDTELENLKAKFNLHSYVIEKRISFPPMIHDIICSPMSICGYLDEYNLLYVAANHFLFFWEYGSEKLWFPYKEIDHSILKVCMVVLKPYIYEQSLVHGLVVITSNELILLGIQKQSEKIEIINLNTSVQLQGSDVVDVVGTKTGRVLLAMRDGTLKEFLYEPSSSFWSYFGYSYSCSIRSLNFVNSSSSPILHLEYDNEFDLLFCLLENSWLCLYDVHDRNCTLLDYQANITERACSLLHYSSSHYQLPSWHVQSLSLLHHHHYITSIITTRGGHRLYFTYSKGDKEMIFRGVKESPCVCEVQDCYYINNDAAMVLSNDSILMIYDTMTTTDLHEVSEYIKECVMGIHCIQEKKQVNTIYSNYLILHCNGIIEYHKIRDNERGNELCTLDSTSLMTYSTLFSSLCSISKIHSDVIRYLIASYCSTPSSEALHHLQSIIVNPIYEGAVIEAIQQYIAFLIQKYATSPLLQSLSSLSISSFDLSSSIKQLKNLAHFLETAFQIEYPIHLNLLSSYKLGILSLYTQTKRIYSLLNYLHHLQVTSFASLTILTSSQLSELQSTSFFTYTSSSAYIQSLTMMIQQGFSVFYAYPWDGPNGFEAICEKLAEGCTSYFSKVEKFLQESFYLIHRGDLSENEEKFVLEKLELCFLHCPPDQIMLMINRILTLLLPFHLLACIQVLLRGRKHLSRCIPDQNRIQTIQQEIEAIVLDIIKRCIYDKEAIAACMMICEEGSMTLKEQLVVWCIQNNQTTVLLQLNEDDMRNCLLTRDFNLLHTVYLIHQQYLKAATLLYEVVILRKYPYINLNLNLNDIAAYIQLCIHDLQENERHLNLERSQYPELKVSELKKLLSQVQLQQEIRGVLCDAVLLNEEELIHYCENHHRYDILLVHMYKEDYWEPYLKDMIIQERSITSNMITQLCSIISKVQEISTESVYTILSYLMGKGMTYDVMTEAAKALSQCIDPSVLLAVLDEFLLLKHEEEWILAVCSFIDQICCSVNYTTHFTVYIQHAVAELEHVIDHQDRAILLQNSLSRFL